MREIFSGPPAEPVMQSSTPLQIPKDF